jgi:hypothetical protein
MLLSLAVWTFDTSDTSRCCFYTLRSRLYGYALYAYALIPVWLCPHFRSYALLALTLLLCCL